MDSRCEPLALQPLATPAGSAAGMAGINCFAVTLPETPFGGIAAGGQGRDRGSEGLAGCRNAKSAPES